MSVIIPFIIRQSGFLAFLLFLLALANGGYVCEGLWQGSGLHGYTIQASAKGGFPRIVSTWAAFVEMLRLTGLAGLMLGLKFWHMLKISRIASKPCSEEDTEANTVIFRSRPGQRH